MSKIIPIKPIKKSRIGLYTIGLKAYWAQFPGLKDRMLEYNQFLQKGMSEHGEIFNYGLVDSETEGRSAGEWFN